MMERTSDSSAGSESPQAEHLYRTLAENAYDLICQTGVTGNYLYVSPNYEQTLGYLPEELLGRSVFDLLHPDDLAQISLQFFRSLAIRQPGQATFRYRHKNGEWRWLETTGKPFLCRGEEWRATFISRDVTERRCMEQELRQESDFRNLVMESASNAIAALDREGCFTLANRRMGEVSGCPLSELEHHDFLSLIHADDRQKVGMQFKEVIEKRKKIVRSEVRWLCKDGTERRFLMNLTPCEAGGKITGAVLTGDDVTDLRQADQMRQKLLDQLQLSQKLEAIGTLTAGLAHDFNNILAGISATTQLLQGEVEDRPQALAEIKLVQKAVSRASELTRQLQGFSCRGKLEMGVVPIAARLAEVINLWSPQLNPGVRVRNEVPQGLPPVWGDAGKLEQVLLNVAINAGQALSLRLEKKERAEVVFGGREEIATELQARTLDLVPGGQVIHLWIRDTGTGIPEGIRSRIFEPFFTTKKAGRNRGLGLAMVYGIVKSHHGGIHIESREGEGTTVHLYLPMATETAFEKAGPLQPPVRPLQPAKVGMILGILIVDDEALVRVGLTRILLGFGAHVWTAADGAEAIQEYRRHPEEITMVLLDSRMPGMSGAETFTELQHMNPEVKVVISSGYLTEEEAEKLQNQGVKAILRKPYAAEILGQCIESVSGCCLAQLHKD